MHQSNKQRQERPSTVPNTADPTITDPTITDPTITDPTITHRDITSLLSPVQTGLAHVEAKMKTVDFSLFTPLANAFVDLIGSGGKRLRPALTLLSAALYSDLEAGANYDKAVALAASIEMIHTATLVHDDVIDGALLRRGSPTLNASWGRGSTVLAGNYMFGQAAQFSASTGNIRAVQIFTDAINIIVDGELRQLFARGDYQQDKDNYYQRIYAKTASLFCAATESGAVITGLPDEEIKQLREYGYNLGMAFQIVDDILDFTGDEESLGKPAGSDLRQGTLTVPFFHYLKSHPTPQEIIEQVRSYTEAGDEYKEKWEANIVQIVADICQSDAIYAARQEAKNFLDLAKENLASFPETIYKRSMLELCDFVLERTY